jgi:hypothetical protein
MTVVPIFRSSSPGVHQVAHDLFNSVGLTDSLTVDSAAGTGEHFSAVALHFLLGPC